MKKLILSIIAVVALAGATWAQGYGHARIVTSKSNSVTTNAATTDLSGGLLNNDNVVWARVACSGTATVSVDLVSGHTYGSGLTTIIPTASITFPSSTYPFIPSAVYAKGNLDGSTNTVRVDIGLE